MTVPQDAMQRLVDRAAILDLYSAYAWGTDRGDNWRIASREMVVTSAVMPPKPVSR